MENEFSRRSDLMGVTRDDELFQPYETDGGWLVVLPGEEDGRREKSGRVLVAETKVTIRLKDRASVTACVGELAESDRRLRERSGRPPWDWQKVMIKENVVRFGVAWYDFDFFEQRKGAYSDPAHAKVYERFGASPKDFEVAHRVV